MTDLEKQTRLSAITGETKTEVLSAFLDLAKEKILRRAYPFGYDEQAEFPSKYDNLQIEIATYLYNKQGAEGETYHSENGIIRTYENADVPDSMLKSIIPLGKVLTHESTQKT